MVAPGGRRFCPFRGRAERAGRVERGAEESPGESWAVRRPVGPGGRARGAALRRPSGSAGLRAAARNRRRAGVRAGSAAKGRVRVSGAGVTGTAARAFLS